MGNERQYYSLMVIGDNPDELIKKYDKSLKVEPWIKYKYDDRVELHKTAIQMTKDMLDNVKDDNQFLKDYLNDRLSALKNMSDFEYYSTITQDYDYDEYGNIITDENPDGKWLTCEKDTNYEFPIRYNPLYFPGPYYSLKKSLISWQKIHHNGIDKYVRCWNLIVGGDMLQEGTDDGQIVANMSKYKDSISQFKSAQDYADFNTSFWMCAVIDKDGKWHDYTETTRFNWMTQFYDKFVAKLDDELITIYKYTK